MSENLENSFTPEQQKEALLERAKVLGIKVTGNIGIDTLKEKIKNHMEGTNEDTNDSGTSTKEETFYEKRNRIRKEQLALVRLRISNMNPEKKDLKGEIFTVANKYVGTVRKFVPFNGEPYHVPKILYNMLKGKTYISKYTEKVEGREYVRTKILPEFGIEILEPLTKEELKKLAVTQAAKGIAS